MWINNAIIKLSFRKQIISIMFVLFVSFIGVLFVISQTILTSSLSEQFLAQANSLTELIRTKIKPAVLAEDIPAVVSAAEGILAFEQVSYIQIFSYEDPLI